jgi:hypothetical protein
MKRPNISVALVVVFLAITLPFGVAALTGGRDHIFIGFLANPIDGTSYLAKMYEGWSGAWHFTLPYTSEPGNGAYVYLFYLFLGHLARWTGLSLIFTFHLARVIGAGLLVFSLLRFYDRLFADRPDLHRTATWLTLIGSGMGWLLLFFGPNPTDFWVAEAYPFLSMYTNPHFPIGLALLVFAFILLIDPSFRFREGWLVVIGLLLAVIQPFGVVVALVVSGGWLVWTWLETRRFEWRPVFCLGVLGGPYLLYQFWVLRVDPVLSVWNRQNLTFSPPLWDFLFAFSPALILAVLGLIQLYKMKEHPARRILISWLALALLLVYFPFSLQRRFMLGFYVPVAALAVFGLDSLRQKLSTGRHPRRARWLTPALFALALPTNLLLILIGLAGAVSHAPILYVTHDEDRALAWIQAQTPQHALILASPDIANLVPAYTGRRVIYGHPFETVSAALEEQRVKEFYSQNTKVNPGSGLIFDRQVDYILYGPRERQLGSGIDLSAFSLVFTSGPVQIYAVQGAH